MKIAIMQPYFLPYLGYFSLIKNTDRFIILDTVQFIRHGWIARNRILKPGIGWQYFNIPLVKHSRETLIKDIQIKDDFDWRTRIMGQIEHYKKSAPYYEYVKLLLEELFSLDFRDITHLNMQSLAVVCRYLGIRFDCRIFSEMKLNIEKVNSPDEWSLNICMALDNVDEYWNPIGGLDFFERSKFESNNIKIHFQKMKDVDYDQKRPNFEPWLSILDVMMFNSKEKINDMLNQYDLL